MDPISDMLIRIKNAQMVQAEHVVLPFSKIKFRLATLLKEAGFLNDVEKRKKKIKRTEHDFIDLTLKYEDGQAAVSGVNIVSKPSRHLYIKAKDLRPVRSGFGLAMISTSKGVMTSKEARKQGLGGEILFEIW